MIIENILIFTKSNTVVLFDAWVNYDYTPAGARNRNSNVYFLRGKNADLPKSVWSG